MPLSGRNWGSLRGRSPSLFELLNAPLDVIEAIMEVGKIRFDLHGLRLEGLYGIVEGEGTEQKEEHETLREREQPQENVSCDVRGVHCP